MTEQGDYSGSVASHYQGRVRYAEAFFSELVKALALDRASVVLDLACGNGELARGFSAYVGRIFGFDRSHAMLEKPRSLGVPNANFSLSDLNRVPVALETKADIATIGRAIPYLDSRVLGQTLSASLKADGAVVVCGSGISRETAWLGAYQPLRKVLAPNRTQMDFSGVGTLRSIGFSRVGSVSCKRTAAYLLQDIVDYALSYSSQTEAILKDPEDFTGKLERAIAPCREPDGTYLTTEISWANIFRLPQRTFDLEFTISG